MAFQLFEVESAGVGVAAEVVLELVERPQDRPVQLDDLLVRLVQQAQGHTRPGRAVDRHGWFSPWSFVVVSASPRTSAASSSAFHSGAVRTLPARGAQAPSRCSASMSRPLTGSGGGPGRRPPSGRARPVRRARPPFPARGPPRVRVRPVGERVGECVQPGVLDQQLDHLVPGGVADGRDAVRAARPPLRACRCTAPVRGRLGCVRCGLVRTQLGGEPSGSAGDRQLGRVEPGQHPGRQLDPLALVEELEQVAPVEPRDASVCGGRPRPPRSCRERRRGRSARSRTHLSARGAGRARW